MENYAELLGSIIGVVIFLIILTIGVILYRKIMYPIPKRNTIIKKHYFLKDRFSHKRLMKFIDYEEFNILKEQLYALQFQPIIQDERLWYLKNESGENYIHIEYKESIVQVTIFAESLLSVTKINLLLEKILFKEQIL